jgi:hypothetical protein
VWGAKDEALVGGSAFELRGDKLLKCPKKRKKSVDNMGFWCQTFSLIFTVVSKVPSKPVHLTRSKHSFNFSLFKTPQTHHEETAEQSLSDPINRESPLGSHHHSRLLRCVSLLLPVQNLRI